MLSQLVVNKSVIELSEGDLTELNVNAIVNAANAQLLLGGGVAGAIRQKGGPSIQEECHRIGGINVGGAVITGAGNLRADYVIHAVGPRMGEGEEEIKLENATRNSLELAVKHKLTSIAFPAISTGIFGFPVDRCAKTMLHTTYDFLLTNEIQLRVIYCLWGRENYQVFYEVLQTLGTDSA